jgi:hypothetical protein
LKQLDLKTLAADVVLGVEEQQPVPARVSPDANARQPEWQQPLAGLPGCVGQIEAAQRQQLVCGILGAATDGGAGQSRGSPKLGRLFVEHGRELWRLRGPSSVDLCEEGAHAVITPGQ